MSGLELKRLAKALRLKPTEICGEADISIPTLYKVYNDGGAEPESKNKVEQAIRRLAEKSKSIAV
jgi:predicted transcriptional regulator